MRLFLGARLPLARAIALRGFARYSSSSLRTPPRRSFRRHLAQCLGGFKLNGNAKKPPGAAGPAPVPKKKRRLKRTTSKH